MSFFSQSWESDSTDENFLKLFSNTIESSTGIKVTPQSALRHSIVFACNRVLSESIASLPLVLYKQDDKGNRVKAKEHSLYNLLNNNPNPEATTMQWRETMITNINLRGNHFSQIIRNRRNEIVSIWGLDTSRIEAKRLQSTGEIVYIYNYDMNINAQNPKKAVFKFDEILHIAGLSLDGICGISPIAYTRESIGLSIAMEEFGARYFKNGANASGAFSIQGELTDTAFERMREGFEKAYSGLKNSHKPLILEGGAKFERITMTNTDSQFLEARKYQKEDISMIFRVPLHMINDLTKANYNSIEQLSLGFVTYSLMPTIVRTEQCMQRDLLTEDERKEGYYIKHNLAALLRGDMKTRFESYHVALNDGVYTIDDILALEDMNPTGDNIGKARFMQGAMTTVDNVINGVNYNKGGVSNA